MFSLCALNSNNAYFHAQIKHYIVEVNLNFKERVNFFLEKKKKNKIPKKNLLFP